MNSDGPEGFGPVRTSGRPHGGLLLFTVACLWAPRSSGWWAVVANAGRSCWTSYPGFWIVSLSLSQSSGWKNKISEGSFLSAPQLMYRPTPQLSPTMMPVRSLLLEVLGVKAEVWACWTSSLSLSYVPSPACSALLRDIESSQQFILNLCVCLCACVCIYICVYIGM